MATSAIQVRVSRFVDDAHAAFAELLEDFEVGDRLTNHD